ncbi:MAG: hypothetical protein WBG73_08070 [Coleofasciculaceae cyanobacterium]
MNPNGKSFLKNLVIPIATALIVGGTAPWWVEALKGNSQGSGNGTPSPSASSSSNNQDSKGVAGDDSINIQGSGNSVTDGSVRASGKSTIQQNSGPGSNISAAGDVNINQLSEVPKFEGQIQHLNLEEKPLGKFEGSKKFLEFITENDQKVVYLNIWPYYSGGKVNLDVPKEIVIPPPNGQAIEWTIYEILDSEKGDFFYDSTWGSRIIRGYFKVVAVYPYRGGGQRIRLKPVAIEDVPR